MKEFVAKIKALAVLSFIERQENIVFLEPSGVGKTHIAILLDYLAIQLNIITRFISIADFMVQLDTTHRQGRYKDVLRRVVGHPR